MGERTEESARDAVRGEDATRHVRTGSAKTFGGLDGALEPSQCLPLQYLVHSGNCIKSRGKSSHDQKPLLRGERIRAAAKPKGAAACAVNTRASL